MPPTFSQAGPFMQRIDNGDWEAMRVWCPGCQKSHHFTIKTFAGPCWEFDGNLEAPSFSPSIEVKRHNGTHCHAFLKEGKWQFLNDCTHELKGQTVDMVKVHGDVRADE